MVAHDGLEPWSGILSLYCSQMDLLIRCSSNPESPAQFENRIKPRLYVRRITRSTMYEKARAGVRKISSVACGFSPIKVHILIT